MSFSLVSVFFSLLKVQKLLLGFLLVLDNTEGGGVRPRGAVFIFIIYSRWLFCCRNQIQQQFHRCTVMLSKKGEKYQVC